MDEVEKNIADLSNADPQARRAAVRKLEILRDPRAVPALIDMIGRGGCTIEGITGIWDRIADSDQPLDKDDLGSEVRDALIQIGTPAIDGLVSALGKKDRPGRESLANMLGEFMDDNTAISALIDCLKDQDKGVRLRAGLILIKRAELWGIDLPEIASALKMRILALKATGGESDFEREKAVAILEYKAFARALGKKTRDGLLEDGVLLAGEKPKPPKGDGGMFRQRRVAYG